MNDIASVLLFTSLFLTTAANSRAEVHQQTQNVVYAESHGVALVMDIFTPTGEKNGLAIVDVISGAWSSDRGKIRDHQRAQVFKIMCQHGYTVFAIRPGSLSRFSLIDMVEHLETGVKWVKQHAESYGIDPDRLGLMGASAGGHLASLLAVRNGRTAVAARATDKTKDKADKNDDATDDATVKAVAVFFPPTDLLQYADDADAAGTARIQAMVLRGEFTNLSAAEIRERLISVSPARLVTPSAPPFLLIHGTADQVVPMRHSEQLKAALEAKDVSVELVLKEGGGHPWLTIHEEVGVIADWFDAQLAKQ